MVGAGAAAASHLATPGRHVWLGLGQPGSSQPGRLVDTEQMSALHQEAAHETATPQPEFGEIGVDGLTLSAVAYWQEDGMHVFRSTEYDVIASNENKQVAILAFVQQSEDYANFLASFGEHTVEDLTISTMILRRLLDIHERAQEHRRRRLAIVRHLRSRGHSVVRGWHHEPAVLT